MKQKEIYGVLFGIITLSAGILTTQQVNADSLDLAPEQEVELGGLCVHITPGEDSVLSENINLQLRAAGLGFLRKPNVKNEKSNYEIFKEAAASGLSVRFTGGAENAPLQEWQVREAMDNKNREYALSPGGPAFQPHLYRVGAAAFDKDGKPFLVKESGDNGCYFEPVTLPEQKVDPTANMDDQTFSIWQLISSLASLIKNLF